MLSFTVFSGCLIVLALHKLLAVYNGFFGPLSKIPGSLLSRFTKIPYVLSVYSGKHEAANIHLHRKYAKPGEYFAPIIRLAPNLYSLAAPEKMVYGISSKMPKSSWYEAWKHPSPHKYTNFTERNVKRHSQNRRKFASIYALSTVVGYESFVDECIDIFVRHLEAAVQSATDLDMGHWFQCYAFDVIGYMTYGKRFGFLDSGLDVSNIMSRLDDNFVYSSIVGVYAWMHPYLAAISVFFGASGPAALQFLNDWARSHLDKIIASSHKGTDPPSETYSPNEATRKTFAQKAVAKQQEDALKTITDWDLMVVCGQNVIAGSDTTSISLSACLYYLIKTPRAMTLLRQELDDCEKEGKWNGLSISFDISQTMQYLQACIKEAMRLHGAVGLPLWRETVDDRTEIRGVLFPKGAVVGVNPWVAHYNQDVWGADVLEFRPERWLEAYALDSKDRLQVMESNYLPFGHGSRTCLGRHISHLEMSKLLPVLVRNFNFDLVHHCKEWQLRNFWFVKPVDFKVKISQRKPLN